MQSESASTPERRSGKDRRRRGQGESHLVWVSVTGVVAIVLILIVGVAVMAKFANVVGEVNELADAREQDRQATLRSACLQQNDSVQRLRETFTESVGVVRPPPPPNPEIEAFIDRYTLKVNATLRYRDCTPAGIEAYFANPPPIKDTDCVPDGKGFCKPETGG